MNTINNYLNDVEMFQNFMNNLNKSNIFEKNFNYNKNDFWYLLLLLSKGYLNDNFHKMFDMINDDFIKKAFTCSLARDDFFDNTFMTDNEDILKLLLSNQYFKFPKIINNYSDLFKKIRNHLSHYNYTYENNIIKFYSNAYKSEICISVATLTLLLLASLSNIGQSKKINAFESSILLINTIPIELTVTNKIENNDITPNDVIRNELNHQLNYIINIIKSNIKDITKEELPFITIDIIKQILPDFMNDIGYDVHIEPLDDNICFQISTYLENNIDIDNHIFNNLYQMVKSDIKMATISYKIFISILYKIINNKDFCNEYKIYLPLLNNELIICYLNIVFCDYAWQHNSIISSNLFEYINPIEEKNIPEKIRNSLSHCHYRFEDITDNSAIVIIEFWDEYESKINFKCRIKRENIKKLTDDYINIFKENKNTNN